MRFPVFITILIFTLVAAVSHVSASEIKVTYLYNLSDFDGTIPYNGVRTFVDEQRSEVYAFTSGGVDIYNPSGMLIYHFDFDRELGGVFDAAVEEDGSILLLTLLDGEYRVVRCNYRGEPRSFIGLGKLPQEFDDFHPGRIISRDGNIYLVSQAEMKVAIIDGQGTFIKGYDIAVLFNMNEKDRMNSGMEGFNLDEGHDRMLFTIPAFGKACIAYPNGDIHEFGKRGSGPGKFGVPSGIASDMNGNLLVTDKLRSVIIVFNKDFNYEKEFGFRGFRPGNVIVPNEITVDHRTNRVYVSQMRRRGVNIYQLSYE